MDARITLDAPENTRAAADLPAERLALAQTAEKVFYRRTMTSEIPWVSCQYPTNALAQEAGLTLDQLTEIVFGACLLDWDAEGERMRRYADRFDAAAEIRIVGEGTDLTISLDGRHGEVDDGRKNMPGGEFFFAPVEDSARGVITFSEYPAVLQRPGARGHPARVRRAGRSSRRRPRAARTSSRASSTGTRAPGASASSASAATPASRAT